MMSLPFSLTDVVDGSTSQRAAALQAASSLELLRRSQQRAFPYVTEVDGESFIVFENVFSPAYFESTAPFTHYLCGRRLGRLLEIGCGVGATGVLAVKRNAADSAVLTDINPDAVANSRRNVEVHELSNRVVCLHSDVFAGLEQTERFDSIYWNVPFMWKPADYVWKNDLERSLFDPGYEILERFFTEAGRFLRRDGRLFIGFGDFGSSERLHVLLSRWGWRAECAASWDRREGRKVQFQMYEAERRDA